MRPVTFVFKDAQLGHASASWDSPAALTDWLKEQPLHEGSCCWSLQTFAHLRMAGYPVSLSDKLIPDTINVVHFDDLARREMPFRAFLVVVRADRPQPFPADLVVVQNKCRIHDPERDHYIPLWPMPGIRPRSQSRADRVETLAYFGIEAYARSDFYGEAMRKELASLGVELRMRCEPEEWYDYSEADMILAVRSASEYDKNLKPPSKLLNAWRAGSVPLLGRESAYQQVGTPGEDYVEVETPEDVIDWVGRLRQDPSVFRRLIDAGQARQEAFSDEQLVKMWADLLFDRAQAQFERWIARPWAIRRSRGLARLPVEIVRSRAAKRRFFRGIRTETPGT